jgi:hypothetical protein
MDLFSGTRRGVFGRKRCAENEIYSDCLCVSIQDAECPKCKKMSHVIVLVAGCYGEGGEDGLARAPLLKGPPGKFEAHYLTGCKYALTLMKDRGNEYTAQWNETLFAHQGG